MHTRLGCGRNDFGHFGIRSEARDVLGDGAIEQLHVLRHIADDPGAFFFGPLREGCAIQPDRAAQRRPDADDGTGEVCLAGARGPDHAQSIARRELKIQVLQHGGIGPRRAGIEPLHGELAVGQRQAG